LDTVFIYGTNIAAKDYKLSNREWINS